MTFKREEKFISSPYLQTLVLSHCHFQVGQLGRAMFAGTPFLDQLTIHSVKIRSIESNAFSYMTRLRSLLLKDTKILKLRIHSFSGLKLISHLNLAGMGLSNIDKCAFCIMENVINLNLTNNQILMLLTDVFAGLPRVSVIDLRHNPIKVIEEATMLNRDLDLYVSTIYYCCYTKNIHNCFSINTFISRIDMCKPLFESMTVHIISIFVGVCVCFVNIAAIVFQRAEAVQKTHNIVTRKKYACNILLTMNCFVLFVVAFVYGKDYIRYETRWIKKNMCSILRLYVAGVFCMGYLLALLQAINQLIATKYALQYRPLTATQCNTLIVFAIFVLTSFICIVFLLDNSSVRDIYCFPLEVTNPSWHLLFYLVYFVLMLFIIFAIITIYVLIAKHAKKSNSRVNSTVNFQATYCSLLRNTSITVMMELLTVMLYFIAAICHTNDSINGQIRLILILIAIFVNSSLYPVNYFAQEGWKRWGRSKCHVPQR